MEKRLPVLFPCCLYLLFIFISPSVTQGCWWFLRQYKTAVCTRLPVVTGTTACPSSAGSIHERKQCCSAQVASMARVWWDYSSHRTPPQQVCVHTHFSTAKSWKKKKKENYENRKGALLEGIFKLTFSLLFWDFSSCIIFRFIQQSWTRKVPPGHPWLHPHLLQNQWKQHSVKPLPHRPLTRWVPKLCRMF